MGDYDNIPDNYVSPNIEEDDDINDVREKEIAELLHESECNDSRIQYGIMQRVSEMNKDFKFWKQSSKSWKGAFKHMRDRNSKLQIKLNEVREAVTVEKEGLGALINVPPEIAEHDQYAPKGYWRATGEVTEQEPQPLLIGSPAAVRHNDLVDRIRNMTDGSDAPGCHWGQWRGEWVHAAADYATIIADVAGVSVDNDILDAACSAIVNDINGAEIGFEFLKDLPAELLQRYEVDNLLPMHVEDVIEEVLYLEEVETSKVMLSLYENWPTDPICGYYGSDEYLMHYEVEALQHNVYYWIWDQEDEDTAPWSQQSVHEIAADWHGGLASALCSLASTGKVHGPIHARQLMSEIDNCLKEARSAGHAHPNPVISEQIEDKNIRNIYKLLYLKFWVLCDAEWMAPLGSIIDRMYLQAEVL